MKPVDLVCRAVENSSNAILRVRLREARRLLTTTSASVKQIAFQVGFEDPLYFSRLFRRRFGTPPSNLRSVPDA